jgi:hypothetical protein
VPKQDTSTLRRRRHTLMASPEPNDPRVSELQLQSARTRLHPQIPVTPGLRAMQPHPHNSYSPSRACSQIVVARGITRPMEATRDEVHAICRNNCDSRYTRCGFGPIGYAAGSAMMQRRFTPNATSRAGRGFAAAAEWLE